MREFEGCYIVSADGVYKELNEVFKSHINCIHKTNNINIVSVYKLNTQEFTREWDPSA